MKNFFKRLCYCESKILNEKYFVSSEGEQIEYSDETKITLIRLTEFVSNGNFTKAKVSKFISKNFRMSSRELTQLWNMENNSDKSENTFRGQVSVTSNILYELFGTTFDEELLTNEAKNLADTLDVLNLGTVYFNDLFISEVDSMISHVDLVQAHYDLSELCDELCVLKSIRKDEAMSKLAYANKIKLGYIKGVLNKPLVCDHSLNYEKVAILKALGIAQGLVSPRTPQDIITFSQEAKEALRGVFRSGNSVDPVHKRELKEFLYNMYTCEGLKNYFKDFTAQEVYEAMNEISKGQW